MTFDNIAILIKSVVTKAKNYTAIIYSLEKGSYKDKYITEYFQMNVCIL